MIHLEKATAVITLLCSFTIIQAEVQNEDIPWSTKHQNLEAIFANEDYHAIAGLECTEYSGRSLGTCHLTVITHSFPISHDSPTKLVCPIQPLEIGNDLAIREIKFLKADKIMITWEGKHIANPRSNYGWKRSAQIISIKDCKQHEYLEVKGYGRDDGVDDEYIAVPSEDYVDIIHKNHEDNKECGESPWCRLRFDYDKNVADRKPFPGSDISKPSKFKAIHGVHWMKNGNPDKYVIIGETHDADSDTGIVYSPATGYMNLERYSSGSFAYSDTNGFTTLCWREPDTLSVYRKIDSRLSCKWLDGTHKDETFVATYWYKNVPRTINTPDGNILLITYGGRKVIIEEVRSDSKCKQIESLDWPGELGPRLFEASFAKNGELCISGTQISKKYDSKSYVQSKEYIFKTNCIKLKSNNAEFTSKCTKSIYSN